MRDLFFVGFLAAFFASGLKRPFLLVLAYVYIDIVAPQRLTYILLNSVPVSLIAAGLALGGWLVLDAKRDVRVAPRQILLLALLVYCGITTGSADFPVQAADKWSWVWKSLAFAIFLPLTLRTRLRIEALLLFMILSAASIIIVGGVKTIASGGGGYGELNLIVTNNSGLYEGSTISTVAVAIIPLILWFARHGTVFKPDWKVALFCYALVFACLLIPVGTSTRTGLLCIVLLALLMLREAKRRLLYVALLCMAPLVVTPFLPATFLARMQLIQGYQSDNSASTRVAVWKWTVDYARTHPFGGGFEAYRGNRIQVETVAVSGATGAQHIERQTTADQGRAYHSAYFEMLGEQGYPGLAMWLLLSVIGLARMEMLRARYRRDAERPWAAPLASALQSAHLVYLLGASFIAIAFQPFIFMLIGAQIGLDTYLARKRTEARRQPFRRASRRVAQPAT